MTTMKDAKILTEKIHGIECIRTNLGGKERFQGLSGELLHVPFKAI